MKRKKAVKEPNLPPGSRFATEESLRDLHRILEGKNFGSLDELNAFMATLQGSQLPIGANRNPTAAEQAQDLAWGAMDAKSPAIARSLAEAALQKDPDCVDALVIAADLAAVSLNQHIRLLQHAVETGERVLGADFFQENKGHFWGILETRPYMRARFALATALHRTGQTLQAIGHYEAILELNPNDNQGIRDILLGCYLATGNLTGAGRLFAEYGDDGGVVFVWGRVLEGSVSTPVRRCRV